MITTILIAIFIELIFRPRIDVTDSNYLELVNSILDKSYFLT